MTQFAIELNCDMGEFEKPVDAEHDRAIMPLISRCNIAVGGHAGNSQTVRCSFRNAQQYNLRIGLHPGYPDKPNFGRKRPTHPWSLILEAIQQQIELGLSIADEEDVVIDHIKFHGALYNDIETDSDLTDSVISLLQQYSGQAVLGLAGGKLQQACEQAKIRFIREAFIDRRYAGITQLQPRSVAGAVFDDIDTVLDQAIAIVRRQPLMTSTGEQVIIGADSLCIHSDTPNVLTMIKALRRQLALESIQVI